MMSVALGRSEQILNALPPRPPVSEVYQTTGGTRRDQTRVTAHFGDDRAELIQLRIVLTLTPIPEGFVVTISTEYVSTDSDSDTQPSPRGRNAAIDERGNRVFSQHVKQLEREEGPAPTLLVQEASMEPPQFSENFRGQFRELLAWRRDVRHFHCRPIDPVILDELLNLACLAPSVGNSQPWRFVLVNDAARRERIRAIFARCNDAARATYTGARATLYGQLKLAGLREAPGHVAVFVDEGTAVGHGLGRHTMPEMVRYSAVAAVQTLWLAARTYGLGVGWVSILEPREVTRALEVPEDWFLIAYLCVGYPVEEHPDPELERQGWQERLAVDRVVIRR